MNDTVRGLYERKSVRLFTDEPLTGEERDTILRSAFEAPTAGNQQLYTIIDVRDPQVRRELAVLCDGQDFIAAAPLVLVFLADAKKWYDMYTYAGCSPRFPGTGDIILAVDDALIAAQNSVCAAWSMGIGSCYIGDVMENCEKMRELLRLPKYVFPAALVIYGRPTEGQLQRRKPERLPEKHLVHIDRYTEMDETDLRELFSPKAGEKDLDEWMRAFCARKYDSGFSREMTRSVREYLRDYDPR